MAKSVEAIVIEGRRYRVLRLSGTRGPAYLLRSESGDVFGLFRYGHEPTRLYASALAPGTPAPAFDAVDLLDDDGRVAVEPRRA